MKSDPLSPVSDRIDIADTHSPDDQAGAYAVLAAMADAVYCVDQAGRFTFINAAFEAMTGYALAELRGTPSTRLYAPEAEALFRARRRQVHRGATVSPHLETLLLLKDGRWLPVELSVSSLIIAGWRLARPSAARWRRRPGPWSSPSCRTRTTPSRK